VHRYGCDMKVVRLLRERSHGNSVMQICNKMREQHQEKYLERAAKFITVCKLFTALQPAGTAAVSRSSMPAVVDGRISA